MDERDVAPDAERLPPQDLDAEQATLGAMLLGGEATVRVAEIIGPTDFYRDAHAAICQACFTLNDRAEPVDLVTVANELRSMDKLDSIGGFEYLDRLQRATPYSANADRYAQIVREKSVLRRLLYTSQDIQRSCYTPEIGAEEALDRAEARILELSQAQGSSEFEHVRDVVIRVYEDAERKHYGGPLPGTPTGYPDLDKYLAGFQPGDLLILAARPSMGKTSLAMCLALNIVTCAEPRPVAVFSLEMSKEQLAAGLMCTEARVNLARWRTGEFRPADWDRIVSAHNRLSAAPLYLDDSAALSPREIRARSRRLKSQQGDLGLIVIDYLQLMQGDRRTDNRVNEISEITRSLKGLAKELETPVMALSQLSRAVEQRPDKRPMLSDLRESGQIEADADVVMFLYREAYYKQKSGDDDDGDSEAARDVLSDDLPPDPTDVIIAKQRSGPTGSVQLAFRRQFKEFVNFDDTRCG